MYMTLSLSMALQSKAEGETSAAISRESKPASPMGSAAKMLH